MIDFLNNTGGLWISYLSRSLLQNTLFLIIVIAILFSAKRVSAQTRFMVGLVGLLKLALPPFIETRALAPVPVTAQFLAAIGRISSGGMVYGVAAPRTAFLNPPGILLVLWASAVVFFTSHAAIRAVRFKIKLRTARFLHTVNSYRRQLGIYQSAYVTVPMTFGLFPNKIFVPTTWQTWSKQCRQLALDHEIAHIRRYDGWSRIFQLVVFALYFFHPLVWLLNRQLDDLREMACDDRTVGDESRGSVLFSKCLVEIAENTVEASLAHPSASALIKRKEHLYRRIKYQMEERIMQSNPEKHLLIAAAISLFILFSITLTESHGSRQPASGAAGLKIHVQSAETIYLNGEKTDLSQLPQRLKASAEARENLQAIVLQIDPGVTMGVVDAVHEVLRELSILRVSYSLGVEEGPKLVLPEKGNEELMKKIPQKNVCNIRFDAEGGLFVDNEMMSRQDMRDHIKKRLMSNPNLIVAVSASGETTMREYITVLDDLKEVGARRISVSGQKTGADSPGTIQKYD